MIEAGSLAARLKQHIWVKGQGGRDDIPLRHRHDLQNGLQSQPRDQPDPALTTPRPGDPVTRLRLPVIRVKMGNFRLTRQWALGPSFWVSVTRTTLQGPLLPDWVLKSIWDTFLDHEPRDRRVLVMAVSRLIQLLLRTLALHWKVL